MKHSGPISGVAAHAERYIATAGYDNDVILWDRATSNSLARGRHDHLVNHVSFAPDGSALVTSSSDYSARIWSLPDMRLQAVLTDHRDDVEMAVFSHSGKHVATCSRDHDVRIFDRSGALRHCLKGHQADVLSVQWALDDRYIVTSGDDGTIRRWDVATASEVETIELAGVETDTVVITRRGEVIAGDDDGRIRIFAGQRHLVEQAHDAGIKRLVASSDGERLVSLGYDRKMIVWAIDEAGLKKRAETAVPQQIWARSADFVDQHTLVLGTFGSTYALYDMANDYWHVDAVENTPAINAVAASDTGIISIGDAGVLRVNGENRRDLGSLCNFLCSFGPILLTGGQLGILFDALTGTVLFRHRSPLNCAAVFKRHGILHAIVGAYTGEGIVFRLDDSSKAIHVATVALHNNAVKGVAADETTIFSVCATGEAAWHAVGDLSERRRLPTAHSRIANGCVALGNGGFASISRDRRLRLWAGDICEELETPHANSVKSIAASQDGRHLATGSYTGVIAVYDLQARQWCRVLRPTTAGISCITAGPDDGIFFASSYDGLIHRIEAV